MSDVIYRSATENDLAEAHALYETARDEMLMTHGISVPPPGGPDELEGERHLLRTGIYRVASQDGELIALSQAIVRDGIWFLSGFWVRPEVKDQGVGGPLLRQVWHAGEQQGARIFCVWSSVDTTAVAAYMKLGMLPGTQILTFSGDSEQVRRLEHPAGYETRPLDPADAAVIDQVVRSTPRPQDHAFWAEGGWHGSRGRLVLRDGRPVGYYYTTAEGMVQPAAWLDPADGEAVLSLALREGLERAGRAGLRPLGLNHLAIRFALERGLRLRVCSHFLTTATFGHLDRYTTSGPMLF